MQRNASKIVLEEGAIWNVTHLWGSVPKIAPGEAASPISIARCSTRIAPGEDAVFHARRVQNSAIKVAQEAGAMQDVMLRNASRIVQREGAT